MNEFKPGERVIVEEGAQFTAVGRTYPTNEHGVGTISEVVKPDSRINDYWVEFDNGENAWANGRYIRRLCEEKVEVTVSGLEALRKALAEKVTDTFEDGTVFRWVSGGRYIYAAVKAGGRYWLTGGAGYYGSASKTYEEMLDIFARPDVTNIEVATGWEAV